MPAIVGAFKINAIGTSGVIHIGDCITISPQAEVRTFAGAGSFNTGDSLKVMNYKTRRMCMTTMQLISRSQGMRKGVCFMNFYINQTIQINYLRLESISNSSILQIGSAGSIKSLSNLYNTGSYVEAAPEVSAQGQPVELQEPDTGSLVPLQPPGR